MAPSNGTQWSSMALDGARFQSNGNSFQSAHLLEDGVIRVIRGHQGSSGVIRYHQGSSAHLLEDGEHISPELLWKGGEREHERRLREIVDEYQLVPAQLREWPEPAASELVRGDEDNQ